MLRLAHRCVTQRWSGPPECSPQDASDLSDAIGRATVVLADNVAEFAADKYTGNEGYAVSFDWAPCLRLPFDITFVEYKMPSKWNERFVGVDMKHRDRSHGVLFTRVDFAEIEAEFSVNIEASRLLQTGEEIVLMTPMLESFDGRPCILGTAIFLPVDKAGKILGIIRKVVPSMQSTITSHQFFPAALAISFMNCKNVVRRDVTDEEGPSAKWLRRQKAPEIRYHVLDINPMKEVLRTEGDIESNGLKKALHICRGHFVTYTEERPLFGKVTGTFWKPSHVRGSVEHGIVDKDYRVKVN